MTVSCQHCHHARRWLVGGGISVECLARGERGYSWDLERECGQFVEKALGDTPPLSSEIKTHGNRG